MRVPLLGGAYTAKSIIANAQRCVNLFPESAETSDASAPVTHYPTPGLLKRVQAASEKPVRCIYNASNGSTFVVIGPTVYSMSSTFVLTIIGSIGDGTDPVFMADNSLVAVIVDGTDYGYAIDLGTNAFKSIVAANFYGGDRVQCVDTYFIFTKPGTSIWYISAPLVSFDMLTTTGGAISAGSISSAGSLYSNDIWPNLALTGGSGSGATATITVSGGAVTNVVITSPGAGYATSDSLSANIGGVVATGFISNPGQDYTDGTYVDVHFIGNHEFVVRATIVVSRGLVTSVTMTTPGTYYQVGDVITADLPGGTGFTWTVATLTASGFAWTVSDVTNSTAFDGLDYAMKSGYPDPLQSLIVMHKEIWLIGTLTTEVWYNSGAADFTFQQLPGAFIEHGTAAKYSVCTQDLAVYWLGNDKQGRGMVYRGAGYAVQRISTFAIEQEIQSYTDISDAIGYIYQQDGHTFYVLNFPTADKTWVYDEATKQWHERVWIDSDGKEHRHRGNCCANVNGAIIVGDYENGTLYQYDTNYFTDDATPIVRIRSFPHIMQDDDRVQYSTFQADIDVGNMPLTTDSTAPQIFLRWSDDRGHTWGNRVSQSLGAAGKYLTNPQWQRLGIARDRVFELSWSAPAKTALQGAYIQFQKTGT